MNKALYIKNWNDGGNNYVLKGNPKNKWVGFQQTVLSQLIASFEDNFNIVIWTDENNENDYYCIPFASLKHLFIDGHKTTGKYPDRWTAIILDHKFLMHSNTQLSVDILEYYNQSLMPPPSIELLEDFFIENAKAEINIRLGQSKFRNDVLKNFGYKCALTQISEMSLLTASHIVPWAHKKEYRGDISNGICLYVELDAFFDKGYISFSDGLKTIITSDTANFSTLLTKKLQEINGKQLQQPKHKKINKEYLEYHRLHIFKG